MNKSVLAVLLPALAILSAILTVACSHHHNQQAKQELQAAADADKQSALEEESAHRDVAVAATPPPSDAAKTQSQPQPTATPTSGKSPCSPGKKPVLLNGPCPGAWHFNAGAAGKPAVCQYDWGPAVTCPSGTKAIGSTAACYGTLGQNVAPADAWIKTPEDCGKKFGKAPKYFNYDLQCCPE